MGFLVNTECVLNSQNATLTPQFGAAVLIGTGAHAVNQTTASGSVIIGRSAGASATGCTNVVIGISAGTSLTTGDCNVAIGGNAMFYNRTGLMNTAIGGGTMTGTYSANGWGASCNTAVGWATLCFITSGNANTAIGTSAGACLTSGSFNTFIGWKAGCCVLTGSCNILIGNCVFGTGLAGVTGCFCIASGAASPAFITANSTGVGFCTSAPAARVHVTGCMIATNEITAYYSDRRLKENITPITNSLEKISTLSGVFYTPNKKAIGFGFEENKRHVGVLADEVEKVLPEVIVPAPFDTATDRESITGEFYKTVKYERIVPLLVAGIKELKNKADDLRTRLNNLKKQNS